MTESKLPARARRRGPWSVLLPFLVLGLALTLLLQPEPEPLPAEPPTVASPEESIAAYSGELEGVSGDWLVATLVPLHADPQRQAFEAASLRKRLELAPGMPWRLSVHWSVPTAREGASARPSGALGAQGAGRAEDPARDPPASIGLTVLRVVDGQGTALEGFEPAPAASDAASSPLAALLAPPGGALAPGERADWVLWGRVPEQGALLEGLVPSEDATFLAATGFQGPFELRATSVRRGDLNLPLARLDRSPDGKTADAASSVQLDGAPKDDPR